MPNLTIVTTPLTSTVLASVRTQTRTNITLLPPTNLSFLSAPGSQRQLPQMLKPHIPTCLLHSHVIAASGSRCGSKVVVLQGVEGHLGGGIKVGEDGPQVRAAGHVHICLLSVQLDASN